jgi:putative membrane protein
MNHPNSSLFKLAAVASILTFAACGSSNQSSQANAPKSAQTASPPAEQYGASMGQPGQGETGATGSSQGGPSTGGGEPSGSQGTGTGASTSESTDNSGSAPRSTMGGSNGQSGGESGSTYGSGGSQYGTSGTTGSTGATNTMGGGSMDVSSLSDAQFAGVLQTINQGRIQEALLGQNKGSTDVKRFAREMVTSHRTVQNKESALFTRLQLTPTDSALSNQLKSDTQSDISTLQSMHGRDFDRSFMDSQVRHLNNALELIDRIIPDVKSSDLKSELQNVRTKVDRHLQEAQRIQATLGQ